MTPATPATRFTMPKALLHLEGLALFGSAIALYASTGGSIWLFVGLLLAPDLAMIGYLRDVRTGALLYNLVHTTLLPTALALSALAAGWTPGLQLALIWAAHIGMDRTVGYGLKYATQFKDTHLNRV